MTMKMKRLLNLCAIVTVTLVIGNYVEASSLEELKEKAQQSDKVIKGNVLEIKKARKKRWEQTQDLARQIFTKFTKVGLKFNHDKDIPTCLYVISTKSSSGTAAARVCMSPKYARDEIGGRLDADDPGYYFVVDYDDVMDKANDENTLFKGNVFEINQIPEKSKDIEKAILKLISKQFDLPEDAVLQDIVNAQRNRMKEEKDKENKEINKERKHAAFIPLGTELANTTIEILNNITKTTKIEFGDASTNRSFIPNDTNPTSSVDFKNKRNDKLYIMTYKPESGLQCKEESQSVSSAYLIFNPRIKKNNTYQPWLYLICGADKDCVFGCQIEIKYGDKYEGVIGGSSLGFIELDEKFNAKDAKKIMEELKSDLQEQISQVLNELLK